jgi:NADH-quinone oxidoreductase subunit M
MGLLSLAIGLPLLCGALLLAFGHDRRAGMVRWFALAASLASLCVTLPLITGFNNALVGMQFTEQHAWIERFNATYHLGVDGISMWFVPLTAFINVIVVFTNIWVPS